MIISPVVGFKSPKIKFKKVVLPDPDLPQTPTRWFFFISRFKLLIISMFFSYWKDTSLKVIFSKLIFLFFKNSISWSEIIFFLLSAKFMFEWIRSIEISPKLIEAMLLIIVLKQGINLTDTAEYIIIKFKAYWCFGYQEKKHKNIQNKNRTNKNSIIYLGTKPISKLLSELSKLSLENLIDLFKKKFFF